MSTNQNLLAWVVYTKHLTKNVPGCGGWGINADDRNGPPSSTNNADLI